MEAGAGVGRLAHSGRGHDVVHVNSQEVIWGGEGEGAWGEGVQWSPPWGQQFSIFYCPYIYVDTGRQWVKVQ